MSKMYILIQDDVPDNLVPVVAAHASLACYLKFQELENTKEWLANSFKKVVCRITKAEFEKAKELPQAHTVMTESALQGREVAVVFAPQPEFPKEFKYFRLWKPQAPPV